MLKLTHCGSCTCRPHPLALFVQAHLKKRQGYRVKAAVISTAYCNWVHANHPDTPHLTQTAVTRQLREWGYDLRKTSQTWVYDHVLDI